MEQCKCGSYALNIDSKVCDICYYKKQLDELTKATIEFLRQINGTEKYWLARQYVIKLTGRVRSVKNKINR